MFNKILSPDNEDIDEMIRAANLLYESADQIVITEIYPKKDDNLFLDCGRWKLEAHLGYYYSDEIYMYMGGYLHAARLLAQSVHLTKKNVDQSVYPIIFLYRHYIELSLKSLIIRGGAACSDFEMTNEDEKNLTNHDLGKLWKIFKPIFCELWSEDYFDSGYDFGSNFQDLVDGIESYIKQLCAIDKDSFSFRYSRKKDRETRNLEGVMRIDITGFAEKIERLVYILQACEWELDHLEDASGLSVSVNI